MIKLIDLYYIDGEPRAHAEDFLYLLMRERQDDPEINISHKELPSWNAHQQFVRSRPYRFWYLIDYMEPDKKESLWVGYVSATNNNEIGIIVQRHARGKGVGPMALRMFLGNHNPLPPSPSSRNGNWQANIAPGNAHSKHVFGKLGFTLIQETYARLPETPV